MPDHSSRSGLLSEASGIALAITFLTGFALVGRIILLDEAASDRTQVLILVIGCGAFLSALITALMVKWVTCGWKPWLRTILATLLCCGIFIPATMVCFAIQNRIIEGHLEPGAFDDGRFSEIFWSLLGAMGLFTPTGIRYLFPWPLLIMGLASLLIFYRWPTKGMDQ